MTQTVKFKKLHNNAHSPEYGTEFSAGADLYACLEKEVSLEPNQSLLIPTGIAVEIPTGYVGLVFARSSVATKRDLAPANKVGVIDSDYRGEIKVSLHNHGTKSQTVNPDERIAQLVIIPYLTASFVEATDLSDTERGSGGFGSTGK